jgi:hypothetical protein
MDKKLCLGSIGVAGLMLLVFLIDIIMGIPFGGAGAIVGIDVVGILAAGVLLYMSVATYLEVR